jgi:hypothetical protein
MRHIIVGIFALLLIGAPTAADAFAVAPATMDLTANRGEVIEKTATIINTSSAEQTYYLDTIKFVPREDGAGPRFIDPEEDKSGLAEWVGFESDSVRVPAQSRAEVPFTIAVPEDVRSGGHYGAVLISDAPADVVARNGALIEAKTAVLLFLNVAGETQEQAAILDFVVDKQGLVDHYATDYRLRIQNQGNVHVAPGGTLRVTDWTGRTLEEVAINEGGGRILPNTTRIFSGAIGTQADGFLGKMKHQLSNLTIGPATISLQMEYGEGKMLEDEGRVWLFPWQALSVIGVGLIAVILLIIKFVKTSKTETTTNKREDL